MKHVSAGLSFLLLGSLLYAADFWTQKPFEKWSASECHDMLRNSPWSKTHKFQGTTIQQRTSAGDFEANTITPNITYYVSFRSATPVRQAVARLARLDAKYDKLDDAGKQALDAKLKKYLEATFPDKIIVQVTYSSNIEDIDRQLAYYWQTQTRESLKGTVYLSGPDGEHVEPIQYYGGTGAEREIQFAFPRNPQAAAGNAATPLAFEFRHPNISEKSSNVTGTPVRQTTRVYLKFDTAEMRFQGATSY